MSTPPISKFELDLYKILAQIYKDNNWSIPKNQFHLLIDLVEWLLRIPERVPRKVHFSDDINHKILTCFEINALRRIKSLLANGGDIKPYLGDLTRSIRNRASRSNDFFSSEWGLLHFHLGADFENKNIRVSRTKKILIAKVTEFDAYLIDIVNHGRGYSDVWGNESIFMTIEKNWPRLLEKNLLRKEIKHIQKVTAHNRIDLRCHGISVPVIINDGLMTSEFGVASDGSQNIAVEIALNIKKEIDFAQNIFLQDYPLVLANLAIHKSGSIGFLCKEAGQFYSFPEINEEYNLERLFKRLLFELKIKYNKKFQNFITT